jgi:DNA repair protein RecN (Recombination protein N)
MNQSNSQTFHLESLQLQNFVTFKNHQIHFQEGLNVIIGETGSGKSLILDALQLVFGSRSDKRMIRSGCEFALVEAHFCAKDSEIKKELDELGFPFEGNDLIIKRMIRTDGSHKCWINHHVCSLQVLVQIAKRYVDIVGQFENQKLLSPKYQLRLLDQFSQITDSTQAFKELYQKYVKLKAELERLHQLQADRIQKMDFLNYQIKEIKDLSPSEGEEEELKLKKQRYLDFERTQILYQQLAQFISEGETGSLAYFISQAKSLIAKNQNLLPGDFVQNFMTFSEQFDEINRQFIQAEPTALDDENIQIVIEKLDAYQRLKRKFGETASGILNKLHKFEEEYHQLVNSEAQYEEIQLQLNQLEAQLKKDAEKLHLERKSSSLKLSKLLTQALRELNMPHAQIFFELEWTNQLSEEGMTKLSLMAETNKGEGIFQVKDVASGGELSRILLSLRQVLSAHDSISIFLFDEIDTGMGGETALLIGKSLKKVSLGTQVITITHLPQIATYADRLISVSKETQIENHSGEVRTESYAKEIFTPDLIKQTVKGMNPLA